jgi:hypothetical protein
MITTYLIIAHLLNDFLLQPRPLIQWKIRSALGVFMHVCLLTLVSVVLLLPFLDKWEVWAVILGISVVHFFTDQAKINIALKYDNFSWPFLADQAIHFISILIGGGLLMKLDLSLPHTWFYDNVYTNMWIWIACLALIFVGYIVDILFFQTKRIKHKGRKIPSVSIRDKILLFSVVYFFYVAAAILFLI